MRAQYNFGHLWCALCVAVLFSCGTVLVAWSAETLVYRVSTDKTYEDVMEDLSFSISSNNYRQTSRNAIGHAIQERGAPNFEEATVVHFCNLELARKLLEVSRDYLIHMPCRVVIWEAENQVFLEAKLVPDLGKANETVLVDQINDTLIKILNQATERWTAENKLNQ